MDVKLPNGTVVKGVPEGTSKEEVMRRAIAAGLAKPEDFGQPAQTAAPTEAPVIETPPAAAPAELPLGDTNLASAEVAAKLATGAAGDLMGNIAAVGQATPFAYGVRALGKLTGMDKIAARAGLDWTDEQIAGMPEEFKQMVTYEPRSEGGKRMHDSMMESLSEAISGSSLETAMQFVSSNMDRLKAGVEKTTGSKVLAEAAVVTPELLLEFLPASMVGRKAGKIPAPNKDDIRDAFFESPDQMEKVKEFRDMAYKELEDSGVRLRGDTVQTAIRNIKAQLAESGKDIDLQGLRPMFNKLDKVFSPKKVQKNGFLHVMTQRPSDIENMRKYINDNFPRDGNKSVIADMNSAIDDFIANDLEGAMLASSKTTKTPEEVKKMFGTARSLAGRVIRTREIDEMFTKASNSTEPDEVLKTQMKRLIDNPRRRKFYSEAEVEAMRDIVKGNVDRETGYLKMLGRIGMTPKTMPITVARFLRAFGEDKYRRMPIVTRAKAVGKALSGETEKTIKAAESLRNQVLAGKNGTQIVERYLKAVPKGKRNARELGEFLSDPKIDLGKIELKGSKLEREAIELARGLRLQAAALGTVGGELAEEVQNEEGNQ